jgi:PilZ domain-containing protein
MTGIQERRRMRRVAVGNHITAWVRGILKVRLVDLSLRGARIEHLGLLRPGFPCTVEFLATFEPLILVTDVVRCAVVGVERRAVGEGHLRCESGLAFAEVTPAQEATLARILEGVNPNGDADTCEMPP